MNTWVTIDILKKIYKDDERMLKGIKRIEEDLNWLECLENAGVDNWSGYDYAQELFNE